MKKKTTKEKEMKRIKKKLSIVDCKINRLWIKRNRIDEQLDYWTLYGYDLEKQLESWDKC